MATKKTTTKVKGIGKKIGRGNQYEGGSSQITIRISKKHHAEILQSIDEFLDQYRKPEYKKYATARQLKII